MPLILDECACQERLDDSVGCEDSFLAVEEDFKLTLVFVFLTAGASSSGEAAMDGPCFQSHILMALRFVYEFISCTYMKCAKNDCEQSHNWTFQLPET